MSNETLNGTIEDNSIIGSIEDPTLESVLVESISIQPITEIDGGNAHSDFSNNYDGGGA